MVAYWGPTVSLCLVDLWYLLISHVYSSGHVGSISKRGNPGSWGGARHIIGYVLPALEPPLMDRLKSPLYNEPTCPSFCWTAHSMPSPPNTSDQLPGRLFEFGSIVLQPSHHFAICLRQAKFVHLWIHNATRPCATRWCRCLWFYTHLHHCPAIKWWSFAIPGRVCFMACTSATPETPYHACWWSSWHSIIWISRCWPSL